MAVNKQRHEAGRRTIPAMIDYECHRCGVRGRVADPEQVSELCHACKAEAAWATLPPETWRMVDEELARNRIVHAIQALRTAHPSIGLPQAMDIVNYRSTWPSDR